MKLSSSLSTSGPAIAPWLSDQGDGTYKNPVLYADYSDPDAIRVGEDFWLTASSFGHVPGLPILHSRDLVNWTLVNHALPRLDHAAHNGLADTAHFSTPRHGGGVWAPSIRFHAGRFWIFFPDPDFGLFVTTATDPRAAWSPPALVKGGRGLIDPCPFWADDGTGYLVHGWAKSRSGIKNRLTLHRLRADHLGVSDEGVVIIDGDRLPGWHTIEGPKLYRRGGYYYVFAPAGGVAEGYQAVFRARSLYGPFEHRIVLARGGTAINGPHQGAWVETAAGADWFLHFQELPAYGRVVHLQPMRWHDDWPVMGHDPDGDGTGEPVATARKPVASETAPSAPASSDDFDTPEPGRQWQWQANPRADWARGSERGGGLRLRCVPWAAASLWSAPNLLLQKFPAPEFVATAALDFAPDVEGAVAGLIVFGFSYFWIGLRRELGRLRLVVCRCDDAHQGGGERTVVSTEVEPGRIFLRISVGEGARCVAAYSRDGVAFTRVDGAFQARSSYWVGAKIGLFASAAAAEPAAGETASPDTASAGHANFAWFRVTSLTAP